MAGVLDGIRVAEMGLWLAGPATGGILSDWGAEVIKIEPLGGDPMRRLYSHLSGSKQDECPPFDQHNRGKRSVALDINSDGGREMAQRIVESSDVFLSNMRPSFLQRVGLDHQHLLELNPRLIYAILTGYGLEGPDRDAPGFDVAAFSARSGLVGRTTPEGTAPPTLPGGFGDTVTAISMAAAIMAGLLHRERTGEGQVVSTSLLRTGIYCIAMDVATRLGLDRIAPPPTRTKPANPMLNSYPAGDGSWFWLIGAEAERHWPGLVAALGSPEVLAEERFSTPRGRRRNGTELVEILDGMFAARSRDEWAAVFAEHDVWWAPVNSIEDLLVDPQLIAAGAYVDMPGAAGQTGRVLATPVDFSAAPIRAAASAPAVGADTDAVLSDLGVDDATRARLRSAGALGGGDDDAAGDSPGS